MGLKSEKRTLLKQPACVAMADKTPKGPKKAIGTACMCGDGSKLLANNYLIFISQMRSDVRLIIVSERIVTKDNVLEKL